MGLAGVVLNIGTSASWIPVGENSSFLPCNLNVGLLKEKTIYLAALSTIAGSNKLFSNLY